uniref:Uncharacterized protein n=1 Tax=Eutreptiella gymnastica TaxID=73025 RepID=A0A7S1HSU5_9EUGL|mmetsp:Transcript_103182/g.177882  ORF Transcript_103182/g.177882 Transcript_103182/m.177882 type:complete len:104 (+) Transcript_103182:356-667(+)
MWGQHALMYPPPSPPSRHRPRFYRVIWCLDMEKSTKDDGITNLVLKAKNKGKTNTETTVSLAPAVWTRQCLDKRHSKHFRWAGVEHPGNVHRDLLLLYISSSA